MRLDEKSEAKLFCIFTLKCDFFQKISPISFGSFSVIFTILFPANGSQARKILYVPLRLYSKSYIAGFPGEQRIGIRVSSISCFEVHPYIQRDFVDQMDAYKHPEPFPYLQ